MPKKKFPHRTCSSWSRYLDEVEGKSINMRTIKRRLQLAGVIGKPGIDERGNFHMHGFFSESKVREVCADLLEDVPIADENGFFEKDGIRYATCKTWAEHLEDENVFISQSTLLAHLKRMHIVGVNGRLGKKGALLKGCFYSEPDVRKAVSSAKGTTTSTRHRVLKNLEGAGVAETIGQREYLAIFAQQGITDHSSLMARTTTWYNKSAQFGSMGGSRKFFGHILGRRIVRITVKTLEEISKELGWSDTIANTADSPLSEAVRKQYFDLFAQQGITDYDSLFAKGAVWLKSEEAQFAGIGNGFAFASCILGRPVKLMSNEIIQEIATRLGWKKVNIEVLSEVPRQLDLPVNDVQAVASQSAVVDEQELAALNESRQKQYLEALSQHGITDYESLFSPSIRWFNSKVAQFPPIGGSIKLFGLILGKAIARVTIAILKEVAEKLGWS